nr:hypothetical protein CFP56_37049 [Quercus suber]
MAVSHRGDGTTSRQSAGCGPWECTVSVLGGRVVYPRPCGRLRYYAMIPSIIAEKRLLRITASTCSRRGTPIGDFEQAVHRPDDEERTVRTGLDR